MGGRLGNEMRQIVQESGLVQTIISQYTECTRTLERFFEIAPDRCWQRNGIGCCNIEKHESEDGLIGPAKEAIIKLRNERLPLTRKLTMLRKTPCPYHKKGFGCVLGELKSPLCASHFCPTHIPEGYLPKYVQMTLINILSGGYDSETMAFHPEQNEETVRQFKSYVDDLIGKTLVKREAA